MQIRIRKITGLYILIKKPQVGLHIIGFIKRKKRNAALPNPNIYEQVMYLIQSVVERVQL